MVALGSNGDNFNWLIKKVSKVISSDFISINDLQLELSLLVNSSWETRHSYSFILHPWKTNVLHKRERVSMRIRTRIHTSSYSLDGTRSIIHNKLILKRWYYKGLNGVSNAGRIYNRLLKLHGNVHAPVIILCRSPGWSLTPKLSWPFIRTWSLKTHGCLSLTMDITRGNCTWPTSNRTTLARTCVRLIRILWGVRLVPFVFVHDYYTCMCLVYIRIYVCIYIVTF